MEDQTEIFCHWLRKVIKKDKRITGKQLAALVECDPSTISSYIRFRTRPDHAMQENIKFHLDVKDEEVIEQGRAEMSGASSDQDTTPEQPYNLSEHQKKVALFQDQAWGEYVNTILLEIEELDPGSRDKIKKMLELERDELRRRTSPQQARQDKLSNS